VFRDIVNANAGCCHGWGESGDQGSISWDQELDFTACSVGWWLMAGAGSFWEESTAGWLLMAGLLWEKSTADWWLISQANRVLVEKLCGKIAEESVLCCMQGRTTRSTSTFSESHSKFSMDWNSKWGRESGGHKGNALMATVVNFADESYLLG
jgi:hypothetical protein